MLKFKKFVTMGIAAVMAVSAMSVSAFAENATDNVAQTEVSDTNEIYVPADAEVGTEYDLGHGIKYRVLDKETYDNMVAEVQTMSMLRSLKYYWYRADLSLYGSMHDETLKVTDDYPYWRVGFSNDQSSGKSTKVSVFMPSGSLIESINISGGGQGAIYAENAYSAGTYTARFSSLYTLEGSAYGFSGETAMDVVY